MSHWSTTVKRISVLLSICVFVLGCHGLGSKKPENPIAPLGNGIRSLSSSAPLSNRFSERELCLETAKTVAEKGYAEEAIKLYEKAEKLDSNAEPVNLPLAPLYAQVGDYSKAIERYQRAIDSGEATSEVRNNLAWTLMETHRYSEAVAVIETGLAEESENPRLTTTLAVTRYRMGDRQKSLEKFQEALGASAAHYNLALLDLEAGNIESAVKHADLAAALPDSTAEIAQLRDSIHSELAASNGQAILR
ncbi:MAG: tetratricopeptide repeat protein [Rubripirellula sp.]